MYSAPFGGHWNQGNGKVEAVTSSGVKENPASCDKGD